MLIRVATIQDIPAIQQIAHTTWPVAYGTILSQEQLTYMLDMMYSEASLQKQFADGHLFFMAEVDGQPDGFASVSLEKDAVYKLNKLYVLPTTQKTGAGKALLHAVTGCARELGGRQLILQVNRYNNAKGFYEKHGFTILQEVKLNIGNGYFMDDYIMGREL